MSVVLRPYQLDLIDRTRAFMLQGVRSVLIQAPTGSGKTLMTAHMLGTSAKKGLASWFVVHRRELIRQSVRAFDEVDLPHGIVAAGFSSNARHAIQIASVQTLARRIQRMRTPRLIVWDECHHLAAGSWSAIYAAYPDAFHIGLTATPVRLDGNGLGRWFREMVQGPSTAALIEQGYLAPYRLYAPPGISVTGLHSRMGDFVRSELAAAADKPTITGDAITHYRKHAPGKRAVVFCVSVEHSKHVAASFNAVGIPAAHVDGDSHPEVRDDTIRRFARAELLVLSNCDLFSEGFDLPALDVAILLRPTQSLSLFLQQVGRALRPFPGKEHAIILDHAGNCERHGLPDDEREWSLDDRRVQKSSNENALSVRVCPSCFAAQPSGRPACTYCEFVFEARPREVAHVDGDLVQVNLLAARRVRRQEQGHAENLQELIDLGKQRGYRNPYAWAHHIFQYRQSRKLAGVGT